MQLDGVLAAQTMPKRRPRCQSMQAKWSISACSARAGGDDGSRSDRLERAFLMRFRQIIATRVRQRALAPC